MLSLNLSSQNNRINLKRTTNETIKNLYLINSHLTTSSSSKSVYYVKIDNLFDDVIYNNVSGDNAIPIAWGFSQQNIQFQSNQNLQPSYNYTIYNEDGTKTLDNVTINLLFRIK